MENKDINNLDPEDIGLKMIMGDRFHDETAEKPKAAEITRNAETPVKAENPAKVVKAPVIEPKDAQWIPAKPETNFFDRLKACATWGVCCGGLSMLLFYWQQTGQMMPSAAVPSLYVCAFVFGWGICKNSARK